MNKDFVLSIILVVLLGLGVWWFASRTTSQDGLPPNTTISVSPTTTATATPNSPNITITSPQPGEFVNSVVTVTGKARVFENQFTVQIKDSTGKIVATAHVFSDAQDAGQYGNYTVKLTIPSGLGTDFKIEALSYSAKGDGSFEGYASVLVKLKTP